MTPAHVGRDGAPMGDETRPGRQRSRIIRALVLSGATDPTIPLEAMLEALRLIESVEQDEEGGA